MKGPDMLWVDWSPVDDLAHPAMVSAYTPSSRAEAFYHRTEYILRDGPTMQAALSAEYARGLRDAAAQFDVIGARGIRKLILALIPADGDK